MINIDPQNDWLLKGNHVELVEQLWQGKGHVNNFQAYDSSKGASWYVCQYLKEDNYFYI